MLENIRKIGLFMIAAQAVIHFAPGRQYEKYIKLVSSVIILFLFMRPFVSGQADLTGEWRTGIEQVVDRFEQEDSWQSDGQDINDMALAQLGKEVKSTLNEGISGEPYRVNSVSFVLDEEESAGAEGYYPQLQKIEVTMAKRDEDGSKPILVEEIAIGNEEEKAERVTGEALRYQEIFAGILDIEPGRVEVICVGGW